MFLMLLAVSICLAIGNASIIKQLIRTQDVISDLDYLLPDWLLDSSSNDSVNSYGV